MANRAVTVDAANLNRRSGLVVKDAVTMGVISRMTVNAVHSFLEMNVIEMDCFRESIRIVRRDDRVLRVQQVPFAIAFEDLSKHPAVTVKVRELSSSELAVEFRSAGLVKKIEFRPQATQARRFGIAIKLSLLFALRRIVLLRRIHLVAVGFVVPPRETHVGRDHVLARMHMTNHALRSGDAAGQLMPDWVTGLVLRNADVAGFRHAEIPSRAVVLGVSRIAVVSVDHMTGSTTGRSIITGMIVRADKVQGGIKQTRLLQAEINGIGLLRRTQSA